MKKAKRIIAAVTALLLTTASSSFASVIADSDSGFVSTTASTAANGESDISDAQLYEKLAQLLKQGDSLKYGEALYTTGTPDGEKWTKELYEQRVEFFGEDLLSKYIVDGEFLRKSVESDMKGLLNKTKNELDKYVDVINEYLMSNSIAGSAYVIKNDGFDKLLITYYGHLEKIKAFIAEIGIDENFVVYSQAQDMVVTKPATTIAVTGTNTATTITMPVVDDPTIQTAVVTVTVMDVTGDNILVKPVDGSPELKSSSKFSLSANKLPADITPKADMKLEITYNGGILETSPAQFGNVKKVVEVKEDTVKEDPTLLKGAKDMTIKDVIELAKKGNDLDWADFKDYNGRDIGSGLYIWEYKLEDGYVLDVGGGDVMKKPIYILLSHDDEKGIDIRTDDVKEYIAASDTPVATGNEEVKSVMLTTESGYEGCYVHLDLMSGTFTMSGSMHQNFAVFGKFERKGNNLYLYGENGSTNVYILHRDGSSLISQSDEKGINLTKGLAFSAENDAFWEKLTSTNESTVKGDANCDTNVNMSDAVIIMQSLANPNKYGVNGTAETHITEQGKINGDITGNNDGITNADALTVQKKLLGLDKTDNQRIDISLIANKVFRYEKSADPGIYDDLCDLSFGSNGIYTYHIGYYTSSNQDQGTWEISGDTLVLTGRYGTNKFRYEDKALIYIAEESDGFSKFTDKSTPKDGDKFNLAEEPDYAAINNLSEIVTIKTDYNPIMSDWSGIGILLEFDSKDYSISLRTNDGHFTTWDIAKGSGPIKNAGVTYDIGNSSYIFWTPDGFEFDADYQNEIVIIGEKDGKSVKLGSIIVTPSNNHTLTAALK